MIKHGEYKKILNLDNKNSFQTHKNGIVDPKFWRLSFFTNVEGNPILKIDKGEKPHFLYKRGSLLLGLLKREGKTICLPHQRVGGTNGP